MTRKLLDLKIKIRNLKRRFTLLDRITPPFTRSDFPFDVIFMKILFMSTERIIRASLFVDLVHFDLKNARDSKTGKPENAFVLFGNSFLAIAKIPKGFQ